MADSDILDDPAGAATTDSDSVPASPVQIFALAAFLVAGASLLAYTFLRLFPDVPTGQMAAITFDAFGVRFSPTVRMLALVMCAGGLGSFIHVATSFADYAGNQRLRANWFWWYVLRLPIGMVLALVIYAVIGGGILGSTATSTASPIGMAAIAFLTGMFSKQATDKLDEVFKTLFKTSPATGDAQRKDKLTAAAPTITSITPSPARAGASTLTIDGTSFTDTTVLLINGRKLAPRLVSPTRLTIDLPGELTGPGSLTVKAIDSGRESAPVTVQIVP